MEAQDERADGAATEAPAPPFQKGGVVFGKTGPGRRRQGPADDRRDGRTRTPASLFKLIAETTGRLEGLIAISGQTESSPGTMLKRRLIHHSLTGTWNPATDNGSMRVEHFYRGERKNFTIEKFRNSGDGKRFDRELRVALAHAQAEGR